MARPVAEADRIESLDVLRGFALLGILLLNIIGFGLPYAAYSNPPVGFISALDPFVWAGIELTAEGAMRCLFSVLFGAGVVLFTTGSGGKSAAIYYKRNFWLLVLGLFDAYVLLWNGDILVNYALGGAVLYFVRNVGAKRLLIAASVMLVLLALMYGAMGFGIDSARQAADVVAMSEDKAALDPEILEGAKVWEDFAVDFTPTDTEISAELAARRAGYVAAFAWNVPHSTEMLTVVMPLLLFWDALVMMLLGMALYKYGILQGVRSTTFYSRMALVGFSVGLLVNGYEVSQAFAHDFALLSVFAQFQPTYHFGRLGMAMGYLGLLMLVIHKDVWRGLRQRLAAVGRMALTNYLMHSLICLFVFTGAGFALVGELYRWQLYGVVLAIWLLQLALSPWWLARFRFGPIEWLWRGLTYVSLGDPSGHWPKLLRESQKD